ALLVPWNPAEPEVHPVPPRLERHPRTRRGDDANVVLGQPHGAEGHLVDRDVQEPRGALGDPQAHHRTLDALVEPEVERQLVGEHALEGRAVPIHRNAVRERTEREAAASVETGRAEVEEQPAVHNLARGQAREQLLPLERGHGRGRGRGPTRRARLLRAGVALFRASAPQREERPADDQRRTSPARHGCGPALLTRTRRPSGTSTRTVALSARRTILTSCCPGAVGTSRRGPGP